MRPLIILLFISVSLLNNIVHAKSYSDEYDSLFLAREEKITNEAKQFKDHPLFHYLNVDGFMALTHVMPPINKQCREQATITSDYCDKRRNKTIEKLKKYGFKSVKQSDFMDLRLFKLITLISGFERDRTQYIMKPRRDISKIDSSRFKKIYKASQKKKAQLTKHLTKSRLVGNQS